MIRVTIPTEESLNASEEAAFVHFHRNEWQKQVKQGRFSLAHSFRGLLSITAGEHSSLIQSLVVKNVCSHLYRQEKKMARTRDKYSLQEPTPCHLILPGRLLCLRGSTACKTVPNASTEHSKHKPVTSSPSISSLAPKTYGHLIMQSVFSLMSKVSIVLIVLTLFKSLKSPLRLKAKT